MKFAVDGARSPEIIQAARSDPTRGHRLDGNTVSDVLLRVPGHHNRSVLRPHYSIIELGHPFVIYTAGELLHS